MLYRRLRDTYRKLWVIPKLHRTYGKLTAADESTKARSGPRLMERVTIRVQAPLELRLSALSARLSNL
jgi:hypothetical protein